MVAIPRTQDWAAAFDRYGRPPWKAKEFRERAAELRKIAAGIVDDSNVQRMILGLEVQYEELAQAAEASDDRI